ncbi:MAG: pilus assembly protein N-terminal domain-containing protein [Devosiaceae bacterium]|nr:pilus assembly protein N-terminal domain-containing protein [Devosiaceae bacterium]
MSIKINKLVFVVIFTFIANLFTTVSLVQAQSVTSDMAGSISVNVNMARVLRINAPAATVIIGNPGIADVTIQDSQTLILTGKSYGQTNLIVLDSAGNPIADTLIEVIQTSDDVVTVYLGLARITLACEPVCQPTATLGDDIDFTSQAISSSVLIEEAAQ